MSCKYKYKYKYATFNISKHEYEYKYWCCCICKHKYKHVFGPISALHALSVFTANVQYSAEFHYSSDKTKTSNVLNVHLGDRELHHTSPRRHTVTAPLNVTTTIPSWLAKWFKVQLSYYYRGNITAGRNEKGRKQKIWANKKELGSSLMSLEQEYNVTLTYEHNFFIHTIMGEYSTTS